MGDARIVAVLAAVVCAIAADATADPDEATIKIARSHYEKGDAAYNLGRFDEAIGWFTKAYEAWPVPDFLYNIAQSYRQAGNCKQALFGYKRYLSLKDKDKSAPLSKKERGEIERFIKELTECAAKTDSSAATPPDALKGTVPAPSTSPQASTSTPTPGTTVTAQAQGAASTSDPAKPTLTASATDKPTEPDADAVAVARPATTVPELVSAYAVAGVAVFRAGGLSMPVQPSFAIGAGYPILAGPIMLDVGVRVSLSPIQYDTMTSTKTAMLSAVHATAAANYTLAPKISLRGDLGLGIAMLNRLADGNPFTDSREAASFKMLSMRFGLSADYAITRNLIATFAPISIDFMLVPGPLFIDSLVQFDVLAGVGYRM